MNQKFAYGLGSPDDGKSFDLDIFSDIGEASWFNDNVSANEVRIRLKQNPGADVRLRLNTQGGDVFEAMAMYGLLLDHKGKVEALVMGLCASAGTIPMLAASKVRIVEAGVVMIHRVWGGLVGSSDDLRDWADVLDKLTDKTAELYAARTKKTKAEMLALMANDHYMTADEAKALGFVDEIVKFQPPPGAKAKASANAYAFACAMLKSGEKAPAEALAHLERMASLSVPPPAPAAPPPAPADPQLNLALGQRPELQENPMPIPKIILAALSLTDEATTEEQAVSAINRLKASAKAGAEIETLVGQTGAAAVGAVRALQEAQTANADLANNVARINVSLSKTKFDAALAQGLKDRKLNQATAKLYTDRFAAAVKVDENGVPAGTGEDVLNDLTGYLAVAPRVAVGQVLHQPRINSGGGSDDPPPPAAHQHNGKAYEAMTGAERAKLKRDNRELHDTMRQDAVERGAL